MGVELVTENTELLQKKNINRLEHIFYEGCKPLMTTNLGVELEHFIVDKNTHKALSYAGERGLNYIISKLLVMYPDAIGVYERGKTADGENTSVLLGFSTKEFALSLEPAAQLEISISPKESISEIEKIYRGFREHLDFILHNCNATCITTGYHPHDRAKDLIMIPKERYKVMDAYFAGIGTGGREMMRATASTQVSIDYTSCSDFRKKYQAAYILMPILKYLTDNTPVYEGKQNDMLLRRSQIWERVDKARTGIVPGALSGSFTFRDYANYLWNMPLLYCPKEYLPVSFTSEKKFTQHHDKNAVLEQSAVQEKVMEHLISAVGSLTPAQIWQQDELSEEAAWHIMSMAFPDARLKNYVEIRGMDSMPIEKALGFAALVKGLFYNENVMDKIDDEVQLQNISEYSIMKAEESIRKYGSAAVVYHQELNELCNKIVQAAYDFLPKDERKYLESIKR